MRAKLEKQRARKKMAAAFCTISKRLKADLGEQITVVQP